MHSPSSLRLALCLMALTPATILAAPVAHQKVAPPPPPPKQKATTTTTANSRVEIATSTAVSVPEVTTALPSTTLSSSATTLPTPSAAATDIPPLFIPLSDKSGDDAHILAVPLVEGRSAEPIPEPNSKSKSASSDSSNEETSAPPPLTIPTTDDSGPNAHILSQSHRRSTHLKNRSGALIAAIRSGQGASAPPPPPVIETEDDNSDCAENRGGCDLKVDDSA